jgi:RecG-like helicase
MRPARRNAKGDLKAAPKKRARELARSEDLVSVEGVLPIGAIEWRHKARIAGRVTSVEVQPWRGAQVLSCTLVDRTGSVTLVFTRRDVPGIETGAQIVAEGTVGEHEGRLALLNPIHEVLKRAPTDPIRN